MEDLLKRESNEAKKYMFKECATGIVEINADNIAKAIAMISSDSNYMYCLDCNKEGSSAFFFKKLFDSRVPKKEDLLLAIRSINKENSTRLYGDECTEIAERIISAGILFDSKLWSVDTLKELFAIIAATTTKKVKRKNLSFASKFCHYAAYYLYLNSDSSLSPDDIPILDSVMKQILPVYAKLNTIEIADYHPEYKTEEEALAFFDSYQRIIRELSEKTGCSRTGIDQLLWYYHKGRELPEKATKKRKKND